MAAFMLIIGVLIGVIFAWLDNKAEQQIPEVDYFGGQQHWI